MNPETLRALDRWIGSPLCRLLGLLPAKRTGSPGPLSPPGRILLLKLTEMGSTVLALPALRELRATWPDAEWSILTLRDSRAIWDLLHLAPPERIITVDERTLASITTSSVQAIWRMVQWQPDVTIDFDFFSRLTAVTAFTVCRGTRIGYQPFHAAGRERGRLLTHRVVYSPLRHTAESFLALTRTATHTSPGEPYFRGGLDDADLSLPAWRPEPVDQEKASALIRSAGIPAGAPLLLMNANASDLLPLRRWPRLYFAELACLLRKRHPALFIALVGGNSDQAESEAVMREIDDHTRLVNLTGKTSLASFLALCANARAIVCNDGGPAHFAGLVGTPSVILFGPESPDLYRPLSANAHPLYRPFPCSPCVHVFNTKKSACRRAVCLEAISVEEVVEALERAGTFS
jgi:ADP-heptose:LPS heptosyltransferase